MQKDIYKQEFPYKGVTLIAVKDKGSCEGCFFYNDSPECVILGAKILPDCKDHIFILKP